jgi:endonuclease YncB( thermonuclease family)
MFLLLASPARATELRQVGILVGVVDAGTVVVEIGPWLGHFIDQRVRLRGVEVPSLTAPNCEAERRAAEAAVAFLRDLYGLRVDLRAAARAEAAGAIPADIVLPGGIDLASVLIQAGWARPRGGARSGWCPL